MCWDTRRETTTRAIVGAFMANLAEIAIEDYRRGQSNLNRTQNSLESMKRFFRSARNGMAIIMGRVSEDAYHADNFTDAALFLEIHSELLKNNPYPIPPDDSTSNLLDQFEEVIGQLLANQSPNEERLKNMEHFLRRLHDYHRAHILIIGCD